MAQNAPFLGPFFPIFGFRPVFHSIPGGLTRNKTMLLQAVVSKLWFEILGGVSAETRMRLKRGWEDGGGELFPKEGGEIEVQGGLPPEFHFPDKTRTTGTWKPPLTDPGSCARCFDEGT